MSNILMIHHGFSGSDVVAALLKQHSGIHWADELYTSVFLKWLAEENKNSLDLITPGRKIDDPIGIIKNSMNKTQKTHYGFEIKPFHFAYINYSYMEFLEKLYALNFTHFILLRRKNVLRSLLPQKTVEKIYFNVNQYGHSFSAFISEFESEMKQFEKPLKEKNILKLNYEDHIEQWPHNAYFRICRFIHAEPEELDIIQNQANPSVADIVENIDEVTTVLHNTPHEWMLKRSKFSQQYVKIRYIIVYVLKTPIRLVNAILDKLLRY